MKKQKKLYEPFDEEETLWIIVSLLSEDFETQMSLLKFVHSKSTSDSVFSDRLPEKLLLITKSYLDNEWIALQKNKNIAKKLSSLLLLMNHYDYHDCTLNFRSWPLWTESSLINDGVWDIIRELSKILLNDLSLGKYSIDQHIVLDDYDPECNSPFTIIEPLYYMHKLNHYLEYEHLPKYNEDYFWYGIMLHSLSRNEQDDFVQYFSFNKNIFTNSSKTKHEIVWKLLSWCIVVMPISYHNDNFKLLLKLKSLLKLILSNEFFDEIRWFHQFFEEFSLWGPPKSRTNPLYCILRNLANNIIKDMNKRILYPDKNIDLHLNIHSFHKKAKLGLYNLRSFYNAKQSLTLSSEDIPYLKYYIEQSGLFLNNSRDMFDEEKIVKHFYNFYNFILNNRERRKFISELTIPPN